MERISRCTEGSLISSIDQVTQATLGKCLSFHQHRYELPNGKLCATYVIKEKEMSIGLHINFGINVSDSYCMAVGS